ncbi:MAG: hypothetical protein NT049_03550 [Planctomycetota bacterium]|nr:hypothetical protein [Planctomycetota bacterium]
MNDLPAINMCVDIDPFDMGDDPKVEQRFRELFRGTFVDTRGAMEEGGSLRIIDDEACAKGDISLVADYYLRFHLEEEKPGAIFGGYAFCDGNRYYWGADRDFYLAWNWEKVFGRFDRSLVQEVRTDDQSFKLITDGKVLRILARSKVWECALPEAIALLEKAKGIKAKFVTLFLARVRERLGPTVEEKVRLACFEPE